MIALFVARSAKLALGMIVTLSVISIRAAEETPILSLALAVAGRSSV